MAETFSLDESRAFRPTQRQQDIILLGLDYIESYGCGEDVLGGEVTFQEIQSLRNRWHRRGPPSRSEVVLADGVPVRCPWRFEESEFGRTAGPEE